MSHEVAPRMCDQVVLLKARGESAYPPPPHLTPQGAIVEALGIGWASAYRVLEAGSA